MVQMKVNPLSGSIGNKSGFKDNEIVRKYRFVLAGIVAGGRGCGRPHTPGVYVDPRKHLGWIINTIERNQILGSLHALIRIFVDQYKLNSKMIISKYSFLIHVFSVDRNVSIAHN